jgi:hypothetical protein
MILNAARKRLWYFDSPRSSVRNNAEVTSTPTSQIYQRTLIDLVYTQLQELGMDEWLYPIHLHLSFRAPIKSAFQRRHEDRVLIVTKALLSGIVVTLGELK